MEQTQEKYMQMFILMIRAAFHGNCRTVYNKILNFHIYCDFNLNFPRFRLTCFLSFPIMKLLSRDNINCKRIAVFIAE